MVKAELRKTILNGTMEVFNPKGLKLTMDDIAKQLGISKKTIYKVFNDKEETVVAPSLFAGQVRNCPLLGQTLSGKIKGSYLGGLWTEV